MMKKTILTLFLAMLMVFSLAACGGGGDAVDNPSRQNDVVEDSGSGNDTVDEEPAGDEIDISGWTAFLGGFEDGTTIYYAFNDDGSRGALMILDSEETHYAMYIGDCTYDDSTGIETILDDETGLGMAYSVTEEGDGFVLDLGALGSAYVESTDTQEILDFMDLAPSEYTDFTEDFHAAAMAAGEGNETGGETATIDVTGWSCYAGGMDDGSTVYYAVSPDETTGMFMLMSPDETESVFLTGEAGYDDEGNIYISDEATGLVLVAAVGMSDDGGYTLDFGGKYALMYDVDPADLINTMMVIESSTTDVTADFIASLD